MALKYLRSAAAGAATGVDWTNAYKTLVLAFAGMAAGDTLYVADDHAETQGSSMTLTSPGTSSSPCLVLCVNTHVTVPPTALGTTASISVTGAFIVTMGGGFAYIYGITFNCGSGVIGGGGYFTSNVLSVVYGWTFDTCKIKLPGTSGALTATLGSSSSNARTSVMKWINTTFKVTGSVSSNITLAGGRFIWINTLSAVDATGTIPTSLFVIGSGSMTILEASGLDLTALGSGKNLVACTTTPGDATVMIRNCQLGASVNVFNPSPAITGPGLEILLDNSDSANTNYRMEHYTFPGKVLSEIVVVRTLGASDGTTPISHKFVSLTAGPTLFMPLEGPWIYLWNELTGSSKNVTVEYLHDSLTNLQNSDIYLEVEGLGTSSLPESVYYNNRVADVFATPANTPAGVGTGNWTTTGLTNPRSQNLVVAFTPRIKGLIRARVCLAKANYTVYVDPMLTIT